jgi:hypothetical protein
MLDYGSAVVLAIAYPHHVRAKIALPVDGSWPSQGGFRSRSEYQLLTPRIFDGGNSKGMPCSSPPAALVTPWNPLEYDSVLVAVGFIRQGAPTGNRSD